MSSSTSNTTDYANIPTPPKTIADFCLIPIGTTTASVSKEVAAVQRLMKASGLSYSMHSAGTTVEGSWDEVMRVIGQAHTLVHQNGVVRVQTDIRAGTRTDKKQTFEEKVSKVETLLAGDE
ncbi:39f59672-1e8d-42d3-8cb3-b1dffb363836 [Sclerotinia trifoliorum]|uniref:39f59672-1e8d-42d3-8cb3-b1dffb363836 n=1 Tax=Sclerotinia trifoliorum TaxID=28548 RepID=A0A8H2VVD5_9HELO|nr:39f59672-1e8d-42d3-8cb3-b1dffb363836 [Sclerotinia trifoliorum]